MKRSPQPLICPGAPMLFYRAALPLSRATLAYVAGVIRRHRRQIGSCWRKLQPRAAGAAGPGAPAQGRDVRRAGGRVRGQHGHGLAVCHRDRGACWPPARPKLRRALRAAKKAGHAFVVIDGTLIPIDRLAADRPFYSGKHRRHGMNLQVIASPDGRDPVGVRRPARRRPRPDRRPDLGHPARAGRRRVNRPGRQGLHRRR